VISDIKRLNNTFSTDGFSYNFGQSEGGMSKVTSSSKLLGTLIVIKVLILLVVLKFV